MRIAPGGSTAREGGNWGGGSAGEELDSLRGVGPPQDVRRSLCLTRLLVPPKGAQGARTLTLDAVQDSSLRAGSRPLRAGALEDLARRVEIFERRSVLLRGEQALGEGHVGTG